jgi:hypothetical protein
VFFLDCTGFKKKEINENENEEEEEEESIGFILIV